MLTAFHQQKKQTILYLSLKPCLAQEVSDTCQLCILSDCACVSLLKVTFGLLSSHTLLLHPAHAMPSAKKLAQMVYLGGGVG